jgi:uncharacterized membrane-anchored protein YhcB (DUF1043 family)
MDKTIVMSIVEFISGLVLEGIILGIVFQQIANRNQEKQEKKLQDEMNKIEIQNRKNTEILQEDIKYMKIDLISQIKESKK